MLVLWRILMVSPLKPFHINNSLMRHLEIIIKNSALTKKDRANIELLPVK